MRYESIELYGYIGFFNGMGLTQIKIDLTQCKSNKIIIRGSNGSGKSTLMSAIHLLPDANDKFIPNMEARKVLHIIDDRTRYTIRYVHPVVNGQRGTTKGFISRSVDNGPFVELNPSGIITSCKEVIYDEFAFDGGFASLAQLSSEDRGLVDKRPTERKKMINAIVSSLDVYNEIYRNISKKYNMLKNLISTISSKIDMIGDQTKLVAGIQQLSKRIDGLESERETTIEAIAAMKLKLSDFKQTLENSEYTEIMQKLQEVVTNINSFESELSIMMAEQHLESFKAVQRYAEDLQKECYALEAEIKTLLDSIPVLLKERDSISASLQDKQIQLDALQSDGNFASIMQTLSDARTKAAQYEEIFNRMGLSNVTMITKDEFNAAMASITRLKEFAGSLIHNTDLGDLQYVVEHPEETELAINMLSSMRKELEDLYQRQIDLSNQSTLYAAKRDIAKELQNRPQKCKIDSCIYIAEALKADKEYPEWQFNEIQENLKAVENQYKATQAQIKQTEALLVASNAIKRIQNELSSHIEFIRKLPVSPDFESTFLDRVLALDPFKDIDALYPYIDCGNMLEEYKILLETIKTYEAEEKMYKSKAVLIDSINADIASIREKLANLSSQIIQKQTTLQSTRETLKTRNQIRDRFSDILKRYSEEYAKNVEERDRLIDIKSQFDSSTIQIKTIETNLLQLSSNLSAVNSEIKSLSEQREALNHSIMMLGEYKTELAEYQKQSTVVEKIRYYSSPSSGIQTVYIGIFMNRILSTANELLGLLFGGEFALQPFIVNDNEFRIPILGDGMLHDDISSMSSAQKALISMIISFSLLQQSSTKYNVLVLDECDGCMDQSNRFAFVQLLDNLMQMLSCEQCFIVSHNSELDTSDCDIIALKNTSNELINGNIIWQY